VTRFEGNFDFERYFMRLDAGCLDLNAFVSNNARLLENQFFAFMPNAYSGRISHFSNLLSL